jgi:hypothetical protein
LSYKEFFENLPKQENFVRTFGSDIGCKAPFVYHGTADFDKFEQWTYEVDTWLDFNSIPSRWAVRLIAAFVSGPASEYFMDFFATDSGSFKMQQIYSGLFEYCFPVEIRRNMRRDLLSVRQRSDEKIRNFIRRVTRLSKRLSDVSDRQMVQIVWDGALSYLRLKWADTGFDFETSSLSALETAAKGYVPNANSPPTRIRQISPHPDQYSLPSFLVTYQIGQVEYYDCHSGTADQGALIPSQTMLPNANT